MTVGSLAKRMFGEKKGQTATEYMLIIAVVVLGAVAAAAVLIPKFKSGVTKVSTDIQESMESSSGKAAECLKDPTKC